jgi:uncharacterized protein (TIGR02118 family)
MIKLVYAVAARPDIDSAEFHRYWLEEHGPKVRSVAESIGALRYVQSHTLDTPINRAMQESRAMPGHYDGITEVWFESLEALQRAMETPAGADAMKMLVEDEHRFIDMPRSTVFMTEEQEIFNLSG